MRYFYATFTDRAAGCIDAETLDEAKVKAAAFGTVKEVKSNPYPTSNRLGEHDDCPPFCYKPGACAGKTACPQNYSCTE